MLTQRLSIADEGSGNFIGDSAPGGASPGERRFGGSPAGPEWSTESPFAQSPGTLRFRFATETVGEGAGSVTLTVERVSGTDGAVTVGYATANGTATAGNDYTARSGTLNFVSGQLTATIQVPILEDAAVEGNETFTVTLSNATGGATLGTPVTATVTITDNDTAQPGSFRWSAATAGVGEGAGSVTLTVERVSGTDGAATVSYATANGTATAGSDYTARSGTLNFASGQTTATVQVPILEDTAVEGDEAFTATLSNPTGGATLGTPITTTVMITDNDSVQPGTLRLTAGAVSVGEGGGSVTLTVERVSGTDGAVTVNYATANGTAMAGSDYTATNGTLNFAAGQASRTISVPVLEDSSVEGNETFTLTLSNAAGGATLGAPAAVTVTISDNDSAPPPQPGTLRLTAGSVSVSEGGGSVTLTVQRVSGTDGAVTVSYATTNGTATAGTDYTATSGTLSFADGQASRTISVPVLEDSSVEGNESFTLTLSNATGGAILGSPAAVTVTITDNDTAPPPPPPSGGGGGGSVDPKLLMMLALVGLLRRRRAGSARLLAEETTQRCL